jgi:hypothetical protein
MAPSALFSFGVEDSQSVILFEGLPALGSLQQVMAGFVVPD